MTELLRFLVSEASASLNPLVAYALVLLSLLRMRASVRFHCSSRKIYFYLFIYCNWVVTLWQWLFYM